MKEKYNGPERRKYPRTDANFVISYKIKKEINGTDFSQSKNVSGGGMLLTTNRKFNPGTILIMTIRFPFLAHKIEIEGQVVETVEIVRHIIYETRIQFYGLEEALLKELSTFVSRRLKFQK